MMKIIVVTGLFLAVSCSDGCQNGAAFYKPQQCSIIVEQQKSNGRYLTLKGKNSYTGKEDNYSDQGGGWNIQYDKYIEVGGIVTKRKDELIIYVHKKDTTLAFPYDCQGKIYQ
ncbi:hypothetical protein [Spirosoma endophyticum]|nr:hypothetical protein [Spirosoma endophyticum]